MFSVPQYNFTFNDSQYVSTWCGAFVTFAIIVVVAIYAYTKGDLISKMHHSHTKVYETREYGVFGPDERFSGLNVAVGLMYKEEFQDDMTEQFYKGTL